MTISGSCLCGAIAFTIEPPIPLFQYCHCSRCRKKTGSAHAANMFVAPAQFHWTRGEEHARRYELTTAERFCSGFCSICGGAVPWLNRIGTMVVVPAGSLDDDPGVRPVRNVHFGSRAAWYEAASTLPEIDGQP